MLLGTVLLWALNATVTRYVLTHGFQPLAYATIRYALATALFWVFTWTRERSFRIAPRDLRYIAIAASMIFVNQLCFVYSVDKTSAATVTLFLGTTPIFIGVVASVIGLERMGRGFWLATAVSLVGVAFVASGLGRVLGPRVRRRARGVDGAHLGDVLGRDHAADAAVLAVPDLCARTGARLAADRGGRDPADDEPVVPLRRAGVDRLRLRGRRPALPDEHPLVHGDLARRPVAGVALLEPAAGARRRASRSSCSAST